MLLDSNVIIYLVNEPKVISAALMSRLRDPHEYRCASLLSFWEIAIKHRKGKLPMPAQFTEEPAEAFERWCARAVIDILPIAPRHIARAMRLSFPHNDPFDRLIAATALCEDQELVTSDGRFEQCAGLKVLRV